MKKMNNYEAPKAEVIELSVNKAFMWGAGTSGTAGAESNNYQGQQP
jgi:hypothetical protein